MIKAQIAVLDFGSQYTHLITRRIRQLGVLAEIFPPMVSLDKLKGVKGLILSGGPSSVYDQTAVKYNPKIFELKIPILGLCYGHQLLANHFGGQVVSGQTKEYGFAGLKLINPSPLFSKTKETQQIWMSHGDSVKILPAGFKKIGETFDCPVAAMADEKRKIYGLQFHPEVAHTKEGLKILGNFLFSICHCEKNWSLNHYFAEIVRQTKKNVGRKNVFLLVSGGVDSAVCFALLEKVLGKKRVFGLHIDNGLMRLDESKKVIADLAKAGFEDLYLYNASSIFLKALVFMVDPEEKRKIIGRTFLKIKDQVMTELKLNPKNWLLGQGTIYPDTIETGGTKHADKIKTHHNRVAEILKLMRLGSLVEPIAELYKDEVRAIGKKNNLPAALLNRHPFPGPGLAIRVLCSTGREKVEKQALINKDLKRSVGKNFKAIVLPVRSVGVQGDNRTYRHPALITGPLDWKKLHDVSVRITNEVSLVNRVVYGLYPKRLDLKLKPAYLTKDRLNLLRRVDDLVTREIKSAGLYNAIWQFPVVL
ncbi:MAG TPA: glutamine-hydrolyzing GMP synthase, partial [Patescibacteria group bacterium]|nr:glutamine-hydrolyzing GMP synthase [Patescibacteria group bacterium]